MPADPKDCSEDAPGRDSGVADDSPELDKTSTRVEAETPMAGSERASATSRFRANRSPIWKHYKGNYAKNKLVSAQCKHCDHKP